MYILYIVDLPNLCSVSRMMSFVIVCRFAPFATRILMRTFVCAVINVFSHQVLRLLVSCLVFFSPRFLLFFRAELVVLDELAYDGVSFRICAIKKKLFEFCNLPKESSMDVTDVVY